ncbi:hypothetical protein [Acidisphaera sp. L21]|uniref:hypothetical protein n=1 Tax=Acidisphaera sp. L21 TaxID=1641851 RepID=UPI00131DEB75|nr:hypothetical protein [Acidisphaera sp. L21]
MIEASGTRYDCEWKQGNRARQGILTFPTGDRYEGAFQGGEFGGRGVIHYANGVRLESEWNKGIVTGPVSIVTPWGLRYNGESRLGRPEGHGVASDVEGNRYEGEWHNGFPAGSGRLVRKADGTTLDGRWTNGCFVDGERHATFHVDPASCVSSSPTPAKSK